MKDLLNGTHRFTRRLFIKSLDSTLLFLGYRSQQGGTNIHHFGGKYLAHAFSREFLYIVFERCSHFATILNRAFSSIARAVRNNGHRITVYLHAGNDQEFLPGRCRIRSGTTRRLSRPSTTSESAYVGFASSISPNFLSKRSGSFCGSLSQTTPYTSPLHMTAKSLSFVTMIRSSFSEMSARMRSTLGLSACLQSKPLFERNFASSMRTFSSSRNRIGVDDDIVVSGQRAGIVQSRRNLFSGERSTKSILYVLNALASREHLQDLPHHDTRALKRGLAVADLRIGHNIFIDIDTFHNKGSIPPTRMKRQWIFCDTMVV